MGSGTMVEGDTSVVSGSSHGLDEVTVPVAEA